MSNTSRERVADLKEFPFDVQQCAFHIGSWNDHGNEVLLKPGSIDMTSAWSPNQEFKIEPLSFWRESKFYPCCTEPWPELFASLKFSRCAYRTTVTPPFRCLTSALPRAPMYRPSIL